MRRFFLPSMLFFSFLLIFCLVSEAPAASLRGVVRDPDGNSLPSPTVLAFARNCPSKGGGGSLRILDVGSRLFESLFKEDLAYAVQAPNYQIALIEGVCYDLYVFEEGYSGISGGRIKASGDITRDFTLQPVTAVNDYTLDGMVRVDLNEAPNPPSGPGIAGVNMIFEWDMGVGHQGCVNNGWPCCDGVLQSNLEEFQATTFADGSFSRTALTPTHTYCITLTKPGFYNETYYWEAQGTSGTTTFLLQEFSQGPSFTAPPAGQTSSQVQLGQSMDLRFKATDPNIDRVTLSVLGTLPPGTSVTNITNPANTPAQQAEIKISGTPTTVGNYPLTIRAQDVWGNLTSRGYTVQVVQNTAPPSFTLPLGGTDTANVNQSYSITFEASDPEGANLIFGIVDDDGDGVYVPDFLDSSTWPPVSSNPLSYTFPSKAGRPNMGDVGSHHLTLRAYDGPPGAPGTLTADKTVVITVVPLIFVDVTSTHLPVDTALTVGADAGDIETARVDFADGDGDLDLIISHPSGSGGSTRIWRNDGSGRFTDVTNLDPGDGIPGRLRKYDGTPINYYGRGVRLAARTVRDNVPDTGPLDLFLANDITAAPTSYLWHKNLATTNPASPKGAFQGEVGLALVGDPTYGVDIERGAKYMTFSQTEYYQATYLAEGVVGGTFNCGAVDYIGSSHAWGPACNTFRNGNNTADDYAYTSDFERADIDRDGDMDIFAAGIAKFDAFGNLVRGEPPKLYLVNEAYSPTCTSPPCASWYYFRTFANGTFPSTWWNSFTFNSAGMFVEQKGVFHDLNRNNKIDLVAVDAESGVAVFKNNSPGPIQHGRVEFEIQPVPPCPSGFFPIEVLAGEVDGDNKPDLVLIGRGNAPVLVALNTTEGMGLQTYPITFDAPRADLLPPNNDDSRGGILFDMDCDGDNDLFIFNNGQDRLYENKTVDNGSTCP